MAEPSERVEGEEILNEYEDGDMEVARDDGSDHGGDGDVESGGGGETGSERETGGVREIQLDEVEKHVIDNMDREMEVAMK